MRAWFAGEFERCLELCDAIAPHDAATRTHVALLRARSLLRLDRADDALRTLQHAAPGANRTDEAIATRMLVGAARVRRGELDDGLALLLAAQADASTAHPAIRSEIALNIGLAHYGKHDFDAAERALSHVRKDADLISARALQYRAWIALSRAQHERAIALFAGALEMLDACRHYDRFFEANCVRALAHLAVERLDRATWDIVRSRRARIDWSANGLAQPRFFIAYCAAAYQLDVEGNALDAAREARHAEAIAPSDAYRAQARCKRASIARCADEPVSHRDHAESAAELLAGVDAAALSGDEKVVPLVVAEELAAVSCRDARSLFTLYEKLSPISPMLYLAHASATLGYRSLVEASVHECSGDQHAALRLYRESFDAFESIGFKRRAVTAALRMARMTGDVRALDSYAARVTSHLSPHSWIRREIAAATSQSIRLTAVQREVLSLICQGKSNPEIARLRKRSLHTIRNLVARLFQIFGVASREELAVQSVRRGLYTPS